MPTRRDNETEPLAHQSPLHSRGDAPGCNLSKAPFSVSLHDAPSVPPHGSYASDSEEESMDAVEEGSYILNLDFTKNGDEDDDDDEWEDIYDEDDDNEKVNNNGEELNTGKIDDDWKARDDNSAGHTVKDDVDFRKYGFMDLEARNTDQGRSSGDADVEDILVFPDVVSAKTPSPHTQPFNLAKPMTPPPPPPRGPPSSPVRDSPLARTQNGQKRQFGPNTAERRYIRFAEEVSRVLIGPMDVDTFLDEFLPEPAADKVMPGPEGAFNGVPLNPRSEAQMYTPLITAINEKGRCPNLKFVDTSVSSERSRGICKPDLTAYEPEDVERLVPIRADQQGTDSKRPKSTTKGRRKQPLRRTKIRATSKKKESRTATRYNANLGLADMYMEVKTKGLDPFCDKHKHNSPKQKSFFSWRNTVGFDSSTATQSKRTLGQMAVYASEACARQHRMFYFSVLIIGTCARLFRWDRAGVIVTKVFDYREHPEMLCEFLWRYGNADAIQRGFDPTVTVASTDERRLFEEVISEEVEFQLNIASTDARALQKHLKLHYEKDKVTKVLVHNRSSSKWEEYLVSVPVTSPRSFVGRCTRAYWSVRIIRDEHGRLAGKVAFLKDVWRIDVPRMKDEGLVYQDMQGKVEKIPGLLACGDVFEIPSLYVSDQIDDGTKQTEPQYKYQSTRTQEFMNADWICSCLHAANDKRRIVKHTHFRLTLDEVGYSLKNFENSRELFRGAGDAFEALDSAYEQCGRLHRDVSLDNIILVRCRKTRLREGRLVDWEFSTIADRTGKTRDYFRSGTWAFMSAQALNARNRDFHHSNGDDLESLFYVTMYYSLLWLRHDTIANLGQWMFKFFDDATVTNGRDDGGTTKRDYIVTPDDFTTLFNFEEPIHTWFKEVYGDLGSTAPNMRTADRPLKWTRENFRNKMDAVNRDLEHVEETDRVEHDVADYYVQTPEVFRATYTSVTNSGLDLAAIMDGFALEEHRGSKRSMEDVELTEEAMVSEGSRKRSRMDYPDEIWDDS